jgi:pilus assembly protein Flp/PilA
MKRFLRKFWQDTQGQDLVEYAMAAGVVAVAAVATIPPLGGVMTNVFNAIGRLIQNNVH